MSKSIQRLTAGMIRVGFPVPCDCYDEHGHLLMRLGSMVQNQRQLSFLLDRGLFGDIRAVATEQRDAKRKVSTTEPEQVQVHDKFFSKKRRLQTAFNYLQTGKEGECCKLVYRVIQDIQQLLPAYADQMLGLAHMDREGPYSISIALLRAILCELVAAHYIPTQEERIPIIGAALTADLSMFSYHDALQQQTTPLDEQQRQKIANHTRDGALRLMETGIMHEDWLNGVLHHHERRDGSGYPFGLKGKTIHATACLLAIADTYSAMILPRKYRPRQTPRNALRELLVSSTERLDPVLCRRFIKELGIYPPGAAVCLNNNEHAIVVRRGSNAKSPIVKTYISARGNLLEKPVKRDTAHAEFAIREMLSEIPRLNFPALMLWLP